MRWNLAIEKNVDVRSFWQVFDFCSWYQKNFVILAEKLVGLLLDVGEAFLCFFCLISFDETNLVYLNSIAGVPNARLTGLTGLARR